MFVFKAQISDWHGSVYSLVQLALNFLGQAESATH